MKLLNIIAFFALLTANAYATDPVILDDKIKLESFSSTVIPLKRVTYIGRLEIRVKRAASLFKDKDGLLRIMADGVEVDCIQFYSTTSRDWRSYIVDVGRTVRTLEIYNGLERKVKIKKIIQLPSRHFGRTYRGNPSEAMDLAGQTVDVAFHLENLIGPQDQQAMAAIRLAASDLMNKLQVLGPMRAMKEIQNLLALFNQHQLLIQDLKRNEITSDLANELAYVEVALKRMID